MSIFDNTNLTAEEKKEIQGMIDLVTAGNINDEAIIVQAFEKDPNLILKLKDILNAKKIAVQTDNKEDFDRIMIEEEILLNSLV